MTINKIITLAAFNEWVGTPGPKNDVTDLVAQPSWNPEECLDYDDYDEYPNPLNLRLFDGEHIHPAICHMLSGSLITNVYLLDHEWRQDGYDCVTLCIAFGTTEYVVGLYDGVGYQREAMLALGMAVGHPELNLKAVESLVQPNLIHTWMTAFKN